MSPTSATSRALQCSELCQLICGHIGSHDKRTLFRLSLSCRRFMEPALDVLWYELDNLVPLVFCMLEDLYQQDVQILEVDPDDGPEEIVTLSFQKSMLAKDWERFETAARRVRILRHGDRWGDVMYRLHSSVFQSLVCAAQGRLGLLPRLQQLTWQTSHNDTYPYIFLFLSPTITHLTVFITTGNIASDRVRFSLLASLVSQCPSVRSLALETFGTVVHSWRDLFSRHSASACASFSLWSCLGSLTLDSVDLSTVTDVLARLPVLTTLILYCCRAIDPLSPSTVKGFPMLQNLSMYGSNIDSSLHVLKRMSCTPLVDLNLHVMEACHESRWVELFRILQNGTSRDSLAIVSFLTQLHDSSGHPVPMCFHTMSPLLQFRRISQFRHDYLHTGLDLGDSDVTCIAKA